MTQPAVAAFPLSWACGWALLIGGIYFLPQAAHLWQARAPHVLLEENLDEVAYAVWASRAAGEHAAQPDPYQLNSNESAPVSFAAAQPLPAWFIGNLARATRLPATVVLLLGSFLWPALTGFLFFVIAWRCGLRERSSLTLCVVFSLLMLPPVLWLMQWRYVMALLSDADPGFRLTLAHSRRYQPQFTAVIHYAAIVFSLMLLHAKTAWLRRGGSALAGITFGLCFYCYYYSWTLLFGWFVLSGVYVWRQWHDQWRAWLGAWLIGLLVAVPYFVLLARHFSDISASAASARTHVLPSDPAIWVTLLVCAVLSCVWRFDREQRIWWWVPLTINFVAALGAMQNVITGIYIQPYHYLHYFARPTTNMALVMLWAWASERWLRGQRGKQVTQNLNWSAIGLSLLVAVIFQWARYRDVASLAREAMAAQPAMQALRQHAAPGAAVYCPASTTREAIPLYTDAVSYFSRQMLLHETPRSRAALQERVVAVQWLSGRSPEAFSNWLKTRPVDVYFQYLQHPPDLPGKAQMESIEMSLQAQFIAWEHTSKPAALELLRYALLPKNVQLEMTRLPQHFNCQRLWADEHYELFALERR